MSELKVEKINLGTSLSSEEPNAAIHITRDDNTSTIVIEENIDSTGAGDIRFWKTNNGAATSDGDNVGLILFYSDKGETQVASIAVDVTDAGHGSARIRLRTKEAADSDMTTRMTIKADGLIGMGTTVPASDLHIKQSGDLKTGEFGICLENLAGVKWRILNNGDGNNNLHFAEGGTSNGYLNDGADVTDINFTGQHRCLPDATSNMTEIQEKIGLIVVSSGNYNNPETYELVTINDSIPTVLLSVLRNQKTAFGVISSEEDKDEDRVYSHGIYHTISQRKNEDDVRMYINSLGEGAIWVSNINGDLENGDYITTCEIPGHGMKQDDDLLHNYTVAKITQDCTFDLEAENYVCEEIEHDGQTYKRAFVGCTYHCG